MFMNHPGITCTLPQPPSYAYIEDEKSSYEVGETVRVVCNQSEGATTWECDIYTGDWNTRSVYCPSSSSGMHAHPLSPVAPEHSE